MSTVPVTVPLNSGLNENVPQANADKPSVAYAENCDFVRTGGIQGRPGFTDVNAFNVRRYFDLAVGVETVGSVSLVNAPFTSQALVRYRDSVGERPALMANGRVWSFNGTTFSDNLFCASTRVDRIAELFQTNDTSDGYTLTNDLAVGYNYGMSNSGYNGQLGSPMLGAVPSVTDYQFFGNTPFIGSACDVRNATGTTFHCIVANDTGSNFLYLIVRNNNDVTFATYQLATDCAVVTTSGGGAGSFAPWCATYDDAFTDFGIPAIWVCYKTNVNSIKLLRVNAATGVVAATATHAIANVVGLSIAVTKAGVSLSTVRVNAVFAIAATNGVLCNQYNPTTLALVGGSTSTFDGAGGIPVGPCTISDHTDLNGDIFVAYVRKIGAGSVNTISSLVIGKYRPGGPSTVHFTYLGSATSPSIAFGLAHAFVTTDPTHPRSILGVTVSTKPDVGMGGTDANHEQSWYEVDVTDVSTLTGIAAEWLTRAPGLVSAGPIESVPRPTAFIPQLKSCIPAEDRMSWRFASSEFKAFNAFGGYKASLGINEVSYIAPRAASLGDETVISGSVPHVLARGYCFENGFTQVAPEVAAQFTAGGSFAAGTYTFQAIWTWRDEAGNVHRSAPTSLPPTATSSLGVNQTLSVTVQNYQLSQREFGKFFIELYASPNGATADSQKYLVISVEQTPNAAQTVITVAAGSVTTSAVPLYTVQGAVFANFPVSADGGVAAVGKRLWLSDGVKVFASKLFNSDGSAPAWNDEGVLQVVPPAPAGRVLALEEMDDKLIILCERGVFYTHGDGPDDRGIGQDFLFPVKISDLGVASEHSSVWTSKGVVFYSANTGATGPGSGGLYLIDRGMGVTPIGLPAMNELGVLDSSAILTYVAERDLLVTSLQPLPFSLGAQADPNLAATGHRLLTLDMRQGNYSVWQPPACVNSLGAPCLGLVGSGGVLWGIFDDDGAGLPLCVGMFDRQDGFDINIAGVGTVAITATVKTNLIYADSNGGAGWGRVRSVRALGQVLAGGAACTLTLSATPDPNAALSGGPLTSTGSAVISVGGSESTWPLGGISAFELRLKQQKCSSLQVTVSMSPAVAQLTAIRLDTMPKRAPAPARTRG